jgi:hypothetical protein
MRSTPGRGTVGKIELPGCALGTLDCLGRCRAGIRHCYARAISSNQAGDSERGGSRQPPDNHSLPCTFHWLGDGESALHVAKHR